MTRAQTRNECDCCSELEGLVEHHGRLFVDIRGIDGNNGKLGTLKAKVDGAEARRWTLTVLLIGTLLTVLGAGFALGGRLSRTETDLENLKARIAPARTGTP